MPNTQNAQQGKAADSSAVYSPRLCNEDLAPTRDQNWSWYNIFSFWMSDVHSMRPALSRRCSRSSASVCLASGLLSIDPPRAECRLRQSLYGKPPNNKKPVIQRSRVQTMCCAVPARACPAVSIAMPGCAPARIRAVRGGVPARKQAAILPACSGSW